MPPKGKQAKKGPTYKAATPIKDLVPATVKQPPRQSRPVKIPDTFPDNADKNDIQQKQFPALFQQWPADQIVKGHDFGLESDNKFEDQQHPAFVQYLKKQMSQEDRVFNWKYLSEVQALKENYLSQHNIESENEYEGAKSLVNLQSSPARKLENGQLQQKQEGEQIEKKVPVVIQTFLRDETEEQMQRRKQDEVQKAAQSKDKKKGKKQQPKEQGPLQVSDVKMMDVQVKKYMCPSGIWIGSQLQIIKLRELKDVYSGESVWQKIYPQENGVPQLNKSGKYWVKLYYMGKSVRIEVDDRIPLGHNMKELFPTSMKSNEKWTLIVAKALVKLFMKANPTQSIVGSGLIIYALTGMITQNVSLSKFNDWQKIQEFMNDQHYTKKDIVLSIFNHKPGAKCPSNYLNSVQEMKDVMLLENSTYKSRRRMRKGSAVGPELIKLQEHYKLQEQQKSHIKEQEKYIQSQVITGCSYCIGDYFDNDSFNMAFSKEKSLKQQHLRVQYNQMSKISLQNKTRQQKLQHRKKKKQIKQKLLIEQKKRVDMICKPIINYHFLKLLANIIIHCQYSHKQILLAKKCILNNLSQPPNYEIPAEKEDSKSGMSTTAIKLKEQGEVNISLQDFSNLQNTQQLLMRSEEGIWVKDEDIMATFDEIQIMYNPNIFAFKTIELIQHQNPGVFSHDENKQILLVEKIGNPHQQESQEQQEQEKQDQQKKQGKINLLFGFFYQQSPWDTVSVPSCMLQKFDFDSYCTTNNISTLNKKLNSTYMTLKNQNSVIKLYTMSKGRYAYWISADSQCKLLSIANYLTQYQGYTSKNLTIEYPPLEMKTYYALTRLKIRHEGEQKNTVILKFGNVPKSLQKNLNFRMISVPEAGVYTSEVSEGIIKRDTQIIQLASQYTRVQLKPGQDHYLLIQSYTNQNIADGSIDLLVLSKLSDASIEQIEQVQPYKIVEKYTPNKYGTIFRQKLFVNNKNNVSFLFKMIEGEEGQPLAGGGKAAKKGSKQETVMEIIQKPLQQKRLVHLKIIKNGELVYYAKGQNQIIISNIELQSTKQNIQYYIQASFDLRQWKSAAIQSEQTQKIYWVAQISGEDSVAFVKDTFKQEKQKQTRKSWEDKQPGRSQKAKKARQRYLLQLKKERGEELTEEEIQIINAPRMTKKQLMEEQKKNQDKKGAKGAKKDDKKGKKQQIAQQKQQQRPLPKSEDNFMTEIKQFIKNLQQCRVMQTFLNEGQEPRIRSKEQQEAIREGALMASENKVGQLMRNIEARQTNKIRDKDKKDKLTILLEDARANFNAEWKKYIEWRIQDKQKDKIRQQKQKGIIDIINQEKPTITQNDLSKMIVQYREVEGHNNKLANVAEMIRKNIKIGGITEKLNNQLAGWQVEQMKATIEQIKNEKVEGIDVQVMKQVHEMLEEAQKNPAIVQEKQAQLKKAGKKGGKK